MNLACIAPWILSLALGLFPAVASATTTLPFQKVLEAANSALAEGDYERLRKLTPYLAPEFESYRIRSGQDLRPALEAATDKKSKKVAEDVLVKLAYANLLEQFDFPKDAEPEALQDRVRLAYLDYHYMLSQRVAQEDFEADGFIRNCFRKSFQLPRSEWPNMIVAKISKLLGISNKPKEP